MKRLMPAVSSFVLLAMSLPTFADQCEIVTKEQAIAAVERINIGDEAQLWCEPCNEKSAKTVKVESVEMSSVREGWMVAINGEGIDLAYTFVKTASESFELTNLALLANCPASDVSATKDFNP